MHTRYFTAWSFLVSSVLRFVAILFCIFLIGCTVSEDADSGRFSTDASTDEESETDTADPETTNNQGTDTEINVTAMDTDADGDRDADTDGDGDADTDGDSDADTDGDSDADTDGDSDADTDTDGDADGDADSDTDTGGDTNCLPPVSPPKCLVKLYPGCDFAGKEVCVNRLGHYDSDDLIALGMPAQSLSSLKVADGYYTQLHFKKSPKLIYKRDLDECLIDDKIDNLVLSITVEERKTCPKRPRVFLAMHGANSLAKSDVDDQWTYVRENLDGMWTNGVGISMEEMVEIWRKIKTRVLIQPTVCKTEQCNWNDGGSVNLQRKYPDIKLEREALALYKNNSTYWAADDVEVAYKEYVDKTGVAPEEQWRLFKNIYSGWGSKPFADIEYNSDAVPLNPNAQHVFDTAKGTFVEASSSYFRVAHVPNGLHNAWRRTHANGNRPFIWFQGAGDGTAETWFQATKNEYFFLEANNIFKPHDVIMLMNYGGGIVNTPELDPKTGEPADSVTGILYWLLHQ